MIDANANRELIERFTAAWQREDLAALTAMLAEDVTYCGTGWDGPAVTVRGRAAVAELFASQLGPAPELTLGPVAGVGERVLSEWRWAPAPDGTVCRGVDIYLVRDGLIATKDVFSKITAG